MKRLKKKIEKILEKFDVKRAALFGSILRGEATEESDIDLLVEFKGKKSLLDLSGLKLDLEETLNCKVDVITYNSLHSSIKTQILAEQVQIL